MEQKTDSQKFSTPTEDPDLPPEDIELGRIAVEIAHIWQRVGLELGLPLHKLKTMENDNPGRSVMAALTMLSTWKDLDENVSRRTLYQAIDNCKAKGSTETTPGAIATLPTNSASENQTEILNKKPEMVDLTNIVIPKIMNKWEYIAEAFRYDLAIIDTIKDRGFRDPEKCCREFFKDWLTTKNGAKAGPKVWSTLLDILKQSNEIADDIVEDIIAKVIQLKCD